MSFAIARNHPRSLAVKSKPVENRRLPSRSRDKSKFCAPRRPQSRPDPRARPSRDPSPPHGRLNNAFSLPGDFDTDSDSDFWSSSAASASPFFLPPADASDSDDFPGESTIRVCLDLEVSDGSASEPMRPSLSPALAFEAVSVSRLALSAPVSAESARIAPLPLADLCADFAGIFECEEDESEALPNGDTIRACIAARVRPAHLIPRIEAAMARGGAQHFVLLLLEPSLAVEGLYAAAPSQREITRVWGDTPDTIANDEPVRFWMYNGSTDRFVEQEEQSFSVLTDAVSL